MLRKGIFQPLVLATILAAGSLALCTMADLWVFGVYREDSLGKVEDLCFLPDGTPYVACHPDGLRGGTHYRDLQGNSTTPSEDDITAHLRGSSLPALPPRASGELSWSERVRSFADGRWPTTYWYFLSDGRPDGAGYFVGYDSKSKTPIGSGPFLV
jgi:hypothetical protein